MHRKLNENSELKLEYGRFMRDYQNHGHMILSTNKIFIRQNIHKYIN